MKEIIEAAKECRIAQRNYFKAKTSIKETFLNVMREKEAALKMALGNKIFAAEDEIAIAAMNMLRAQEAWIKGRIMPNQLASMQAERRLDELIEAESKPKNNQEVLF